MLPLYYYYILLYSIWKKGTVLPKKKTLTQIAPIREKISAPSLFSSAKWRIMCLRCRPMRRREVKMVKEIKRLSLMKCIDLVKFIIGRKVTILEKRHSFRLVLKRWEGRSAREFGDRMGLEKYFDHFQVYFALFGWSCIWNLLLCKNNGWSAIFSILECSAWVFWEPIYWDLSYSQSREQKDT